MLAREVRGDGARPFTEEVWGQCLLRKGGANAKTKMTQGACVYTGKALQLYNFILFLQVNWVK